MAVQEGQDILLAMIPIFSPCSATAVLSRSLQARHRCTLQLQTCSDCRCHVALSLLLDDLFSCWTRVATRK